MTHFFSKVDITLNDTVIIEPYTHKKTMGLLTLSYKFVVESILSFCITCWGANSSKEEGMKVDRIFKISEKFATHAPHLDELCYKRTLDKVISISITHPLSRFLNKSKSNRIDRYSHIMSENSDT